MDQEGVFALRQGVDQGQEFATLRPAGRVQGQIIELDAHRSRGLDFGSVPPVLRRAAAKVQDRGELVVLDELTEPWVGFAARMTRPSWTMPRLLPVKGRVRNATGTAAETRTIASIDLRMRARTRPGWTLVSFPTRSTCHVVVANVVFP